MNDWLGRRGSSRSWTGSGVADPQIPTSRGRRSPYNRHQKIPHRGNIPHRGTKTGLHRPRLTDGNGSKSKTMTKRQVSESTNKTVERLAIFTMFAVIWMTILFASALIFNLMF